MHQTFYIPANSGFHPVGGRSGEGREAPFPPNVLHDLAPPLGPQPPKGRGGGRGEREGEKRTKGEGRLGGRKGESLRKLGVGCLSKGACMPYACM